MTPTQNSLEQKQTSDISAFHEQFRPYVKQIFRGGLILTGSPQAAEKLQTEIYLKAFLEYVPASQISDFRRWLLRIVRNCFTEAREPNKSSSSRRLDYERAVELIAAAAPDNFKTT